MKSSIRRQSKRRLNKRGHVLVWALIIMPIALGAAGFATDLGNWYLQIQRIQRAADAAALAGDPYLPGDFTNAKKAALEELKKNKLTPDEINGAVIQVAPGKPSALRVSVKRTVPNQFVSIIGGGKFATFTRDATADHSDGLHLGNGSNVLGGYEPNDGSGTWGNPKAFSGGYYLQVSAPNAMKVDGDRFSSGTCSMKYYVPSADYPTNDKYAPLGITGCSGLTNTERNTQGYTYRVNILGKAGAGSSQLVLQAYDPGFARAGGNRCTSKGEEFTAVGVPMWDNGNGCTGESGYPGEGAWPTAYSVYSDSKLTNSVSTCNTYPGTFNASADQGKPNFNWIHRWSTICTPFNVDLTKDATYFVNVRSLGSTGSGTNSFALRAGLSSSGSPAGVNVPLSQASLMIEGNVHMSMFNSISNANQEFSLTQISSDWAGRPIDFQFFDIGDSRVGGKMQQGTMTLVDSFGNPVPGQCYLDPPGGGEQPINNCSAQIGGIDRHYQGQLVNFRWDVPSNFVCNKTSKLADGGCWVFIRIVYPNSVDVTDNSTWSLDQPDQPLRLIE